VHGLRIGIQILEPTVPATINAVARAEELGIDAAWLRFGPVVDPDPVALFAAVAMRTERIMLGTCVVPTYPRHPLALAQEARVVGELAPGRFRLGVGPSHRFVMEDALGIPFRKPLTHLREYIQLLKLALQRGSQVEFEGEFFKVRADWGQPLGIPIMASALQRKSFELAGEVADGAISGLCPLDYIEHVALPALNAGAARAPRSRPPMVMHVVLCVREDPAEVREAAMRQFGFYPRIRSYRRMFVAAGFSEAAQGSMSEAMLESFVLSGEEASVAEQLRRIAATGVDEVLCSIVGAGPDRQASTDRALQFLAEASDSE
jgi:F420-dependent oxidoreductase-like protein